MFLPEMHKKNLIILILILSLHDQQTVFMCIGILHSPKLRGLSKLFPIFWFLI